MIKNIYFSSVAASSITRGAFIATLSWSAMILSGDVVYVGLMFALGHAVNVILGPLAGYLIDRYGKRSLVQIGQAINAFSFAVPALFMLNGIDVTTVNLAVITVISAFAVLLMAGSLETIQQHIASCTGTSQTEMSAIAGAIRQGFMVAGVGGAGFLIHYWSIEIAFLVCAFSSTTTVVLVTWMPNYLEESAKGTGFVQSSFEGFKMLLNNRLIGRLALLVAIGFSVGQMSNALLPGLIVDNLGAGSRIFATVDALWSIGGVVFAFVAARIASRFEVYQVEFYAGIVLGILLILASVTKSPISLMITYFFLGGSFSILKVVADGRILEHCSPSLVGRTRTNIQSVISIMGLLVYVSPFILSIENAGTGFFFWGVVVAAASFVMLLKDRR